MGCGQGRRPEPGIVSNRLLRGITPPLLVAGARRLKRRVRRSRLPDPEWEYVGEAWPRRAGDMRGWNVDSVVDAYRAKLPIFRQALVGTGPIGVATSAAVPISEPGIFEQNTLLAFAYALALASR